MQKITPFLLMNGRVEEAVKFYTSVFKNAKVIEEMRSGADGPLLSVALELEGQRIILLNPGPETAFNMAVSFFITCETQAEVDELWDKLLEGGGAPIQCGWLKDKFGLHWQVVPSAFGRMIGDKDPAKAQRAMQAMTQMVKLDIAALERAYNAA